MHFQFDIANNSSTPPAPPQPVTPETVPDLLRQMLEQQNKLLTQLIQVQTEHLNQVRAAAQDNLARWRNLLARWQNDYPAFGEHCKKAYPLMEKAYVEMLATMVDELGQEEDEALNNEFSVQEFLDRYGMRVGQFSHLLTIIGPLSEAHQQNEASKSATGGPGVQ